MSFVDFTPDCTMVLPCLTALVSPSFRLVYFTEGFWVCSMLRASAGAQARAA